MRIMIARICVLLFFIRIVLTLYADQAGKWDWRQQYVGGITNAAFSKSGRLIFVSSEQNAIAAIDAKSGQIVWRHLLSPLVDTDANQRANFLYLEKENLVLAINSLATTLTAWNAENGALKWSSTLHDGEISNNFRRLPTLLRNPFDNNIYVHAGQAGLYVVNSKNGELVNSIKGPITYQSMYLYENTHVSLVELKQDVIVSARVDSETMKPTPNVNIEGIDPESCQHIGAFIFCTGTESKWIDIETGTVTSFNFSSVSSIRPSGSGYIAVHEFDAIHLFDASMRKISTFDMMHKLAVQTIADTTFVTAIDNSCTIQVWVLTSGAKKLAMTHSTRIVEEFKSCNIAEVYPYNDRHNSRALILLSNNELIMTHNTKTFWIRDEALARVSAIEMLDLPLTESQANIEIEFSDDENGVDDWHRKHTDGVAAIVAHFVKRVRSQIQQLRRSMLAAVQHAMNIAETGSIKHATTLDTGKFERDYFGMHKLILLVSDDGIAFGLDNRDGSVRWRSPLGLKIRPNSAKLFVARTTAYHPHPARVYLTFEDDLFGNTNLITMDPIIGTIIESRQLQNKAALVTLLPCLTENSVSALLIILSEKLTLVYPEKEALQCSPKSIHVMLPDSSESTYKAFKGYKVEVKRDISSGFNQVLLLQTWRTVITWPKSASLSIIPKREEERVHSLGRVLGDRSVLYKYVNPHLVALLAHTDSTVALALLDSVTGTIVHQERHINSRLPATLHNTTPLVHCENWIVYPIWSEKARRCEMVVIDMYEGGYQTDANRFSAFAPTLSPPMVMRQSYIFVQSPTAIGVTNTERGLTNRVVLFALPLGGLVEMSKGLLDARRPLVPTPEHREEGIRPYMPELPLMTENVVNYNCSLEKIKLIRTFPSGLESTSLTLAAGIDIFYTRLTPSGTFDILKDDFDHYFISMVLIALVLASLISKRLAKNKDLKQAWK